MFKKPVNVKVRTALRESNKRSLRKDLETCFPAFQTDEAAREQLANLLSKRAEVEQVRLSTYAGTNITLFTSGNEPVVFQFGDGTLVPTCHLLIRCPNILPPLFTHEPVFAILQGGADLMLPGVILPSRLSESLGVFAKGQMRSIWVRGFTSPLGVGRMAVSSADLQAMSSSGALKGKGLFVLHLFGDHLWNLGPKVQPPRGDIRPYAVEESSLEIDYDSGELENEGSDIEEVIGEDQPQLDAWEDGEEEVEEIQEKTEEVAEKIEEESSTAGPSMDELLRAAFFLAARRQVKDKDLPMLASTFYANFMITAKPSGETVDIKRSSFKKLGKFLSLLEKDGLIKTSETKGVLSITSINRIHDEYKNFRPTHWETEPNESEASSSVPVSASTAATEPRDPYIVELYKCTSTFAAMLSEQNQSRDAYYTFSQLRTILNEYVTLHNLANPSNPRMVVLDPFLSDNLVQKGQRSIVLEMARDALVQEFIAKQTPYHRVTPPEGEPLLRRGAVKPIQILVEQRGGRKNMTIITGLETFAIVPDKFAKEIQKKLASSTSVSPLPGKNATGVAVQIQGSMIKEIAELLTTQYMIPKKYVEVYDKTK